VLEGDVADPNDAATGRCEAPADNDYTVFLDAAALNGARIGIPRAGFLEPIPVPGTDRQSGQLTPEEGRVMADAIAVLEAQGAVIVDPADLPTVLDPDPARNLLSFGVCAGANAANAMTAASTVAATGVRFFTSLSRPSIRSGRSGSAVWRVS